MQEDGRMRATVTSSRGPQIDGVLEHPAGKGLRRLIRVPGVDSAMRFGRPSSRPDDDATATHGAIGTAPTSRGLEAPRDVAEGIEPVERAFAFLDLCGFTAFIATHGEHAAIDTLSRFRSLTRELTVRRGIRVGKWLGDGVMLIGVEVGPTIATAAELIARYDGRPLALRGGVAHGQVLIIDGDDYIGRPTNLAARLCQTARPGELLAVGYHASVLPSWITVHGTRSVTLRGIGRLPRVQQLGVVSDVELPTFTASVPPNTGRPSA
jgi:adenylate cyclase